MDLRRAGAVALGAMLGAGIRWAAVLGLGDGGVGPAILAVNVVGCLVLGVVAELPPRDVDTDTRALLGAGLCGALTTWSALAVEVAGDLRAGDWTAGLGWLGANLSAGIAAAVAGRALGRRRWAEAS
jgi:CrcB protein